MTRIPKGIEGSILSDVHGRSKFETTAERNIKETLDQVPDRTPTVKVFLQKLHEHWLGRRKPGQEVHTYFEEPVRDLALWERLSKAKVGNGKDIFCILNPLTQHIPLEDKIVTIEPPRREDDTLFNRMHDISRMYAAEYHLPGIEYAETLKRIVEADPPKDLKNGSFYILPGSLIEAGGYWAVLGLRWNEDNSVWEWKISKLFTPWNADSLVVLIEKKPNN